MHHFAYRRGVSHTNVLHAEEVDLSRARRRGRNALLLLFERDARASLPRLRRRLRRHARHARLLFGQGQLESRRARNARQARRRHGRRVGRRTSPRACGQGSARRNRVLGRRQDARGDGVRARCRHPCLQRRVRSRASGAQRRRRGAGIDGAHRLPREPGRRRQDPPQDRDGQGREQIRRALRGGACALRACEPASRDRAQPACTCISAARSRTSIRSAMRLPC